MGTRLTKLDNKISKKKTILKFTPLLQEDYGGSKDCTLTSITAIIFHLLDERVEVQDIYDVVEEKAKKYRYSGDKGTSPMFISRIMNESFEHFKISYKAKSAYLKNLLKFNYDFIKKEIQAGRPVVLNIFSDGRGCYTNHSVTIVGYAITISDEKYLVVYDNWYKSTAYVDYSKLCNISSINYLC